MTEHCLAVDGVTKAFGALRAVDGVSFHVRPGEIFGFLGPNGAGKTTTLRMIMGITRPDGGHVRFAGADRMDRRRVGYLPEERGLYEDARLVEMLAYLGALRGMPHRTARREAERWLDRLGLADRARDKVATLSKGNQQKLQLAGALLHRPALAVLDEPFSGLDPLNQELFLERIRELRDDGTAVLLSAHQLDLVERIADRVFLISRGREVLHGTLEEVRRAVAGGAGEVLELAVRAPAGPSAHAIAGAIARAAPGAEHRVRATADGLVHLEVALPAGADLGPLLGEVARHYPVERVSMRALSLHQIYVRAVTGEPVPEAAAREEVTADA